MVLKISDIMNRDVFTLAPETSADEAAWALAVRGLGGAPVRDHSGRLVGVLCRTDLTDPARRPFGRGARTVGELMTRALLTLRDSDLAMNAVRLMVREEVQRIIVLDDDGELCGIVTPHDVLDALIHGDAFDDSAGPTLH